MTKTATAENYHKYHDDRWGKMPFEIRVFHQYNYLRDIAGLDHAVVMNLIDGETPPKNLVPEPSFCASATEKIQDDYLYDS